MRAPVSAAVLPLPTAPADESSAPSFDDFDLPRKVRAALVLDDIEVPTPVQAAVLPDALAGRDVLARSQTGSGKTLAFGIPVLTRLAGSTSRPHCPRALVIVPTRELAGQVERSLELIARGLRLRLVTVYGGSRYDRQIDALRAGADVVIATPGRLQDLIDRGALDPRHVEITVLDEADHLCDLGFFPAVDQLLSATPAEAQRLLLSATLDGDVDTLVRKHLREPRVHQVHPTGGSVRSMDHHVLVVGGYQAKVDAAVALVEANPRAIVFVRTKAGASEVRDALAAQGVSAVDLHGDLGQRVRERNLARFADGRARAVVATDVAARGIHVDEVGLVVHFDAPNDPKAYVHRSGRTARAGQGGAVVTLVTPRHVDGVRRLHRGADIKAKHHDIRSAPKPMTAAALAAAPEERPAGRGGGQGTGRPRHAGRPTRRTPQGGSGRSERRTGQGGPARADRTERRPAKGGPAHGKQRWSKADRAQRP